jgi:diaminopimelate epimerase
MRMINFVKAHGCGNDFIIFRGAEGAPPRTPDFIRRLCDRNRGVGADGALWLSIAEGGGKVRMEFFNSDGSRASMCGNALRCAALYSSGRLFRDGRKNIDIITDAGELGASLEGPGMVRIEIPVRSQFQKSTLDVCGVKMEVCHGDTGVPHAVVRVSGLRGMDILAPGRALRSHEFFKPAGVNADFIEFEPGSESGMLIRTYERGVEGETASCGTGAAAAAVCAAVFWGGKPPFRLISADNDVLSVDLRTDGNIVNRVSLTAPASESFEGMFPEGRF